jgi:hypothetical protein
VLTDVTRSLGLDEPAEGLLRANWRQALGPEVAGACRLEKLDGGRLILGVDSSALSYEFSMRREEIRSRINAFLRGNDTPGAGAGAGGAGAGGAGEITEVRVKLRMQHGR